MAKKKRILKIGERRKTKVVCPCNGQCKHEQVSRTGEFDYGYCNDKDKMHVLWYEKFDPNKQSI